MEATSSMELPKNCKLVSTNSSYGKQFNAMEAVKDQKAEGVVSSNFQIIDFKQGEEEYALHIDQIKEVVITPNITRMPQTPSFVRGVANIRGNIIAIIDLEEMFGLKRTNANHIGKNFTLVVQSEDLKMGILVNE